jgi:hypothetical protein
MAEGIVADEGMGAISGLGEQVLVIPGTLPQLNDVVRSSKGHWNNYSSEKKKTEKLIQTYILKAKLKPISNPVWFHFSWITKDYKVDADNIAFAKKYIIDALCSMKILPKDGRDTVKGWIDDFPPKDPENPRVEVLIYELQDEEEGAE